ncbi:MULTISPECIES: DndE family protein [Marinobacter]|uniref:DndE family protein n=1 Tax=Marinobacter TaxID=2742 RepID=UPI001B1D5986|nr:DndE family protein [Marinobacter sp.]MBO6813111.1 DndE family protein [Marinobacter sp.]MBO6873686.1 DndE family protein [Marinobacter sp.]
MFPTRIQLSKRTWDRLQYLQTKTQLTPNVMARIAMSLALRDIRTASIIENKPEQTHVINRDVLFGDHEKEYEALIRQFCSEQKVKTDIQDIIRYLIDDGLHKLGHVKSLLDLKALFNNPS